MSGEPLLVLDDRHALGADRLQWIVRRAKGKGAWGRWEGIAFVASNTGVLERVLREKGVYPTPEAKMALLHQPNTFKEWLTIRDREQIEERSAA